MPLEVELKFSCPDLETVRNRLLALNADCTGKFFEHNLVFDRAEGPSLKDRSILLRLRRARECTLTLKRRPPSGCDDSVKVREEIETTVSDFDSTRRILEGLGFKKALVYEKIRETWILLDCEICLDLLPFGSFVEIEGDREMLFKCAAALNFDRRRSITKNYHQLFREHQVEAGMEPEDSFPFAEPQRTELIDRLEREKACAKGA